MCLPWRIRSRADCTTECRRRLRFLETIDENSKSLVDPNRERDHVDSRRSFRFKRSVTCDVVTITLRPLKKASRLFSGLMAEEEIRTSLLNPHRMEQPNRKDPAVPYGVGYRTPQQLQGHTRLMSLSNKLLPVNSEKSTCRSLFKFWVSPESAFWFA